MKYHLQAQKLENLQENLEWILLKLQEVKKMEELLRMILKNLFPPQQKILMKLKKIK